MGIENLTKQKRIELEEDLERFLNDRIWCHKNNIDYCNPDFEKAREIIYKEYYSEEGK